MCVRMVADWTLCHEYVFCFQAEYGIRDLVRSRGLGDVYKRQDTTSVAHARILEDTIGVVTHIREGRAGEAAIQGLSLIHI